MIQSSPVRWDAGARRPVDRSGPAGTLPELLVRRARVSPLVVAQWSRADRGWAPITWQAYETIAARLARFFREHGLMPGERVGILARGSVRWDWANMGILGARGVAVGMDPLSEDSAVSELVRQAELRGIVVDDVAHLQRLEGLRGSGIRFALILDGEPEPVPGICAVFLSEFLSELKEHVAPREWNRSRADDPATMIFTSGTTGAPKGILYTHAQVHMAIDAILEAFGDLREGTRLISWLPLANIFQRTINLCAVAGGGETYYLEDPKELFQEIPKIGPHVLVGVPRLFEKVHAAFRREVDHLPLSKRVLIQGALCVAARHHRARGRSLSPVRPLHFAIDRTVLSSIREKIWGKNLRYLVSGSAPMPKLVLEELRALGTPVLEAYATSECAIPIAINRPNGSKLGTVGRVARGNEVRLAEDGELLVRGPGVCRRYADDEPCSVDAQGFLLTGDFATMDKEGYITLTGRKSEVFKTSTGRRVAPLAVERALRQLSDVEEAVVYGAGRKSLVAVVSLAKTDEGCKKGGGPARLSADLERVTKGLPEYLRPRGFVLVHRPFSILGGELTSNMKLRRHAIEAQYRAHLEALYAEMETPRLPRPSRQRASLSDVELLWL